MARTIAEIKDQICGEYMRNEQVAAAYGFTPGDSFSTHFSKASIESVAFYIFAVGSWVLESLFDTHKAEVNERVERIMPHRPKWYRDMVLRFMKNKELIEDTDEYDTTGMADDEIAAALVVKHAAATEDDHTSILTIKVAGENEGARAPLDADTEAQLAAYIREIKDAGVRVSLVNIPADVFNCSLDIYYDPLLSLEQVEAACREVIKDYIENLPFNGEYSNMALVDRLQAVEGVHIPEMKGASTSAAGSEEVVGIDARYVPEAGYFTVGEVTLTMKAK